LSDSRVHEPRGKPRRRAVPQENDGGLMSSISEP